MILELFLSLTFFVENNLASNQAESCIREYPNLRITCVSAYKRRILQSKHQCRDLCLQLSAQTCQYSRIKSSCELHNIVTGLKKNTNLKGRYVRSTKTEMVTEDSDNVISSSCVSSVVPAIGFFLFVNDCNLGESEQSDDITSKQFTDNSLAIMKQHREPVILTDQLPIQKIQTDATIRSSSSHLSASHLTSRTRPQQGFQNPNSLLSNVLSCASGLSIHIEVIDGIQVIAKFLATFQTHTAEACLYLCTRNVLTDGSPLKTECRSAQYNRISKQCILFNTSITPTGYAQYIPNDDVIYFEKICLSNRSVYRMCGEALRRVPQYILVGHATAVINAPSHTYCVEMCLRSLETFDFTCRSAIHFYEHPKANCILNKDSARTRPQYFISEANEKVDYVELAECIMRDTYDLQKLPRNITSE